MAAAVAVEEASHIPHFLHYALDQLAARIARSHGHHSYGVDIRDMGFHCLHRSLRIDCQAEKRTLGMYLSAQGLEAPVKLHVGGEYVTLSQFDEGKELLRILHHKMYVQRESGVTLHSFHGIGAEGKVRHEMGIHHIHVKPVHAILCKLIYVPAEVHQIGTHY